MSSHSTDLEIEKLQLMEDMLYQKARHSFKAFVLATFPEYEMNWHHRIMVNTLQDFVHGKIRKLMINIPPQCGKLIDDNYPVLTANGWRRHGSLQVGDMVYNEKGQFTRIIATNDPISCNAALTTEDETIYTHENHEWLVEIESLKVAMTTKEIADYLRNFPKIPIKLPRLNKLKEFSREFDREFGIPGYLYGLWLCSPNKGQFIIQVDRIVANETIYLIEQYGLGWKELASNKYYIYVHIPELDEQVAGLDDYPTPQVKRIIGSVIASSEEVKLGLIAGLMDAGRLRIYDSIEGKYGMAVEGDQLACDLYCIFRSLGWNEIDFHSVGHDVDRSLKNPYIVRFTINSIPPVLNKNINKFLQVCPGPIEKTSTQIKEVRIITSMGFNRPGKCIQVDNPSGLYCIGLDMIVTHNSELVSRRLPAFWLGLRPDLHFISASYGTELAKRFNRDVTRIIGSQEYKRIFPDSRINSKGGSKSNDEVNNALLLEIIGKKGFLQSASVGGWLTGVPVDVGSIDDPHKDRTEAESDVMRDKVWDWYIDVFKTRLHKDSQVLLTMTRWHEDDLAGRILNSEKGEWHVLKLPAIYEETDDAHPLDPRKEGEPLWPERHALKDILEIKRQSPRNFVSLQQQRPRPDEGSMVKKAHFRFYDEMPATFDETCFSWDCAFKGDKQSDFVVGEAWGAVGPYRYLLGEIRGKFDFLQTIEAIRTLIEMFPFIMSILIEDKANGSAIITTLRQQIPGIIPVNPTDSKRGRLQAVLPHYESGCVLLPNRQNNPWVDDYIDELCAFPYGKYDDRVDCSSQALFHMSRHRSEAFYDFAPISITKESVNKGGLASSIDPFNKGRI